ncbi:MAG: glycosyltransferase [Planctomycetaceae bacterium]|nr:glycosyltransferase [Planctomycetaceae bacterium]
MRTTVIIPQFGRSELSVQAVSTFQSFHQKDSAEVLIVDDGSESSHLKTLQSMLNGNVRILAQRRRRGVTAAWNLAAQNSQTEFLVFLNNDTLSTGRWLDNLLDPLSDPQVLLSGSQLRVEHLLPKVCWRNREIRPILSGWCLAIRRSVFESINGFDPQFQLYFSDTDLQCRLLLAASHDRPLEAVPGLLIRHLEHRSTCTLPTRNRIWREDRDRFVRKWTDFETEGNDEAASNL